MQRITEVDLDHFGDLPNNLVIMDRGRPETALAILEWDEFDLFKDLFYEPVTAIMERIQ